jgi:putrescine transport system permease protein
MRLPRLLVGLPPFLWLVVFFLAPFALVFKISLSDTITAAPPYKPTIDLSAGWEALKEALAAFDFETYRMLTEDSLYLAAFLSSLRIAAISTLLLVLVGYPVALAMSRASERWKPVLLTLIILPFWTSFLIRVYAWIGILKPDGFLNAALTKLGLIAEPLQILNTDIAVFIGIVYAYLPFMVLPLYAVLDRLDDTLLEAAADLGCPPWKAFLTVTLPLSLPGVAAGAMLVFIPAMGEFVIPDLLGGTDTLMLGKVIWNEFFSNRDWPVASAIAVALLGVLLVPIVFYERLQQRSLEGTRP